MLHFYPFATNPSVNKLIFNYYGHTAPLRNSRSNAKQRFSERKCMKVTTSIQIVCKYNQSMQHLHPLKHSAALQGAATKEEMNFIADPEIQS